MKNIFFILLTLLLFTSCSSDPCQNTTYKHNLENALRGKVNTHRKANGQESISSKVFNEFFKCAAISINSPVEIEKEITFKTETTDCIDKMKLYKKGSLFYLEIYEESEQEGIDWCAESSYLYEFKFSGEDIRDFKLKMIAG